MKSAKNMVRKTIVLSIAILCMGIVVGKPVYSLTIATDKPQYEPGEMVTVTGRLTDNGAGIPSANVCVNFTDPHGEPLFSLCPSTNATGYYTVTYTLQSDARAGTYHVTADAEDYGLEASTSFEVLGILLTISTDKPHYNPGALVTTTGQLADHGVGIPSADVCVSIVDPNDELIFGQCPSTNSTGYYTVTYTLATNAVAGTYHVTAEADDYSLQETTTFEVPPGFICGDINDDGIINVGDVVYLVSYLYRGGDPPNPPYCYD